MNSSRIVELYRLNDFHETLQKSYFEAAKWYWTRFGQHPVKVTKVRTKDYRVISPKGHPKENWRISGKNYSPC